MSTDTIADLLTRVRNAQMAKHRFVEIPCSKMKVGIVKVMLDMGYILGYKVLQDNKQGVIKVALKYDPISKQPAISTIKRISRPGLRVYTPVQEIPRVMNGLGIAVLSTSKGIMTGKQAKANNLGGEVLCYIS